MAVCGGIACLGADLLLRWASSSDWLRQWVEQKASQTLGRTVRLQKMSASFMGVKLDGLEISQAGGFQQGTFLAVQRIRLRLALLHLLHGHLKLRSFTVSGAQLYLERTEDGSFNWEDLLAPASSFGNQPKEQPDDVPFNITLQQLVLRQTDITFTDLQTHTKMMLSDLLFSVQRFGFQQEFSAKWKSEFSYETDGKIFTIPIEWAGRADFKNLNWDQAYAQITRLTARYQEASLQGELRVDNFSHPSVKTNLTLNRFSSQILSQLGRDFPAFSLPQAVLEAQFSFNTEKQTLSAQSLRFSLPGMQTFLTGSGNYATQKLDSAQLTLEADLGKTAELFPDWNQQYRPAGQFRASGLWETDGATFSGSLQNGAVQLERVGKFSALSAQLSGAGKIPFVSAKTQVSFNGKLNEEDFQGSVNLARNPRHIEADVLLRARRVVLPPAAAAAADPVPAAGFVEDTRLTVANMPAQAWPPVNIRADIQIDSLDAPYVYGTDIAFRSQLTGVTPDVKKTHGQLTLSMGKGEIKDLYHLTNANAVMKVLFLSINVVGKVFNSMNVFAVLDGLGDGLLEAVGADQDTSQPDQVIQTVTGPDGQPIQIKVPYTDRKINGRLEYDAFVTDVTFKRGVADVKGGSFVSDTVSFTLDGTTDFNTGKLDMTVQAAPGKHEADGIMPLTLKVGGTVNNPEGNMSLIGSVSSLLTQGISNNFASRSVKKGIGGIFGLFKKKSSQPVTDAEPSASGWPKQPAEPAVAAESAEAVPEPRPTDLTGEK